MTDQFFDCFMEPSLENFTFSQQEIFNHPEYHPYSEDLKVLQGLLDKNDLENAIELNTVNLMLSPRAHLYKQYALDKLNRPEEAKSEGYMAHIILEGISLTGDGTVERPYRVTSISDERDMVQFLNEEFAGQSLVQANDKIMDMIQCKSGKEIYFDITIPYQRMQHMMDNGMMESPLAAKPKANAPQQKKWWEFWK